MDLSKIMSISGKTGLFKVVSQMKNAVLVESLTDKKRFPAFAHEKMSSLEEIAIFTSAEEKPLKDILKAMHEKLEGKPGPDPHGDAAKLQSFFLEVVPDYDQDRVYLSDIKKIVSWYNQLLEHNLLDFTEKEEEKKEEGEKEEMKTEEIKQEETTEEPKPKKKKATESKAEATEKKETKKESEPKPKKK